MDKNMIAYCGSYCGVCEGKDKFGCNGCHACKETPSGENAALQNAVSKRVMRTAESARLYHAASCRQPLMIRSMETTAFACEI